MDTEPIVYYIFVIFAGSAILASVALYARQSLIIGYILMGVVVGQYGFNLIKDMSRISAIADIGIIFLLFLLGLNLQPQDLLHMLRKTTLVTVISASIFAFVGILIPFSFGFSLQDSLIVGLSMMFSSTILGLKLLPTTDLHHKHAGEIIVSILLLQDLIAILILLVIQGVGKGQNLWLDVLTMSLSLPLLTLSALIFSKYVLMPLICRFDKIEEYVFLMTIAWCLSMAEAAKILGLSHEIGAFIGGVAMASSPVTRVIAEKLKPLRDFFLVMFFFTLGAMLNLEVLYMILPPALVLALSMLLLKPWIFRYLLMKLSEPAHLSLEMGVRLGQISEFSLLIAIIALHSHLVSQHASYLIQVATIFTFIASSYYIVMYYPTPVAVSDRLRRD